MVESRKIAIFIICVLSVSGSCSRLNKCNDMPVPAVSFNVYPRGIDYDLRTIGGYKIFTSQGYAGIIVYHYMENEFLAFDLACPNDYQQGCKVEYNSSTLLLECKCCGTTFSIFDGFPRNNVDIYPCPLHKYNALLPYDDILNITN